MKDILSMAHRGSGSSVAQGLRLQRIAEAVLAFHAQFLRVGAGAPTPVLRD
jgi:hypothetical protein